MITKKRMGLDAPFFLYIQVSHVLNSKKLRKLRKLKKLKKLKTIVFSLPFGSFLGFDIRL